MTGCNFSVTEKGNMDASALYMWFQDHFVPSLSLERPILLLIESGTIDMDIIEVAKRNKIEIYGVCFCTPQKKSPCLNTFQLSQTGLS